MVRMMHLVMHRRPARVVMPVGGHRRTRRPRRRPVPVLRHGRHPRKPRRAGYSGAAAAAAAHPRRRRRRGVHAGHYRGRWRRRDVDPGHDRRRARRSVEPAAGAGGAAGAVSVVTLIPRNLHLDHPPVHGRAMQRVDRALRRVRVAKLNKREPLRGAVRVADDVELLDRAVASEHLAHRRLVVGQPLRQRTDVTLRGIDHPLRSLTAEPQPRPRLVLARHLRGGGGARGAAPPHRAIDRRVPAVAANLTRHERDVRAEPPEVFLRAVNLVVPGFAARAARGAVDVAQRAVDERQLAQLRALVLVEVVVHGLHEALDHRRGAVDLLVRVTGDDDV
eukprot:31056-Pelagococcus_subviridis.AAC.7